MKHEALHDVVANLIQMGATLPRSESDWLSTLNNALGRVEVNIATVSILAFVHGGMVDLRDANTVTRYLSMSCKTLGKYVDLAGEVANKVLGCVDIHAEHTMAATRLMKEANRSASLS